MNKVGQNHTIVIGFGLPGRTVVEVLEARRRSYTIVELNADAVDRVSKSGKSIIVGDGREVEVLKRAGIERASLVVVSIPHDAQAIEIVRTVRLARPDVAILARCHYTSTGIELLAMRVQQVVVEEQAVAREFAKLIDKLPY
jgi:voltage-gated potassium channel Kch